MKKRWAKVKKGDVLDLSGREWVVEKIKPGKKKAEVKIRHRSNVVRDTVRLDDKVRIADKPEPRERRRTEPPPRPKKQPKKPPAPAHGDPWETQQDRIEKQLGQILGARLVGEATDEDAGYYVPLVDDTTIDAHMVIYHGGIPDVPRDDLFAEHARQHAAAEAGDRRLAVSHWHTEKRPTEGKKKKSKKG